MEIWNSGKTSCIFLWGHLHLTLSLPNFWEIGVLSATLFSNIRPCITSKVLKIIICCLILVKFSKSDKNTLFFTILHLNILYFECGKLNVMLHALKVMGIGDVGSERVKEIQYYINISVLWFNIFRSKWIMQIFSQKQENIPVYPVTLSVPAMWTLTLGKQVRSRPRWWVQFRSRLHCLYFIYKLGLHLCIK